MYRTSLIVRLLTSLCLLNMVPRCLDFRVRFYDIKVQLMSQFRCLESEAAIVMIVELRAWWFVKDLYRHGSYTCAAEH